MTITLPDPPYNDEKGNRRTFSIASPPEEAGHLLMVTRLPNLRFVPTMADAGASRQPWAGESRFVNAKFLRDQIGNMAAPIFYLAGPPGLVAAVSRAVLEAGADPEHLRSEEFEGY